MPMPAEFCYPDEDPTQETDESLVHIDALVVDLQVAQYECIQEAKGALRKARAVAGTPLEAEYRRDLKRHMQNAMHYGRKLADLQS